jgi:hypothetical protein
MKKLALVLVVLGFTAAVAYLLGTEGGRARRDDALSKVRKVADRDAETEIDLRETASDVAQSGTDIAGDVAREVGASG